MFRLIFRYFLRFLYLIYVLISSFLKKTASFISDNYLKIIPGILIIFAGFVGYLTFWSFIKLSNFNKSNFVSNVNQIYDREGQFIGYVAPKISVFTKLNDFPKILIDTVLAVEDRKFFSHCGISFSGIIRSAIEYIPRKISGYRPRGGSTITQQLMRQLYLDDSISFYRKIKEIAISIFATFKISKEDILEIYLNQAYFCNNIYGFTMAANVFWGKELNSHH